MKNKLRIIFKRSSIIVSLALVILVASMSIGYAFYSEELSAIGAINLDVTSNIDCIATNLANTDNNNTNYIDSNFVNQEYKNKSIITSKVYGSFDSGQGDYMTMVIKIKNVSSKQQTLTEFASSTTINGINLSQPRLLNLVVGDVLEPNESRDVKVIYYYNDRINTQTSFEAEFKLIFEDGNVSVTRPSMIGRMDNGTFETDNGTISSIVNIANGFSVSVKYYLRLDNTDGSVSLVDGSNNSSSYSSILAQGTNEDRTIYFKVDFGSLESVSTKLYIETENGETYDVKTLTFIKKNTSPSKPESLVPVTIEVSNKNAWDGITRFDVTFVVDNTANDTALENFSLVIKFKDDCPIAVINNYAVGLGEWDNETLTYTINGIHSWDANRSHISVPAKETQKFGIINIGFTGDHQKVEDFIDYMAVKSGVNDSVVAQHTCSLNSNNVLTCS